MQMGGVAGVTAGSEMGSRAASAGIAGGRVARSIGNRFVGNGNVSPPVGSDIPPAAPSAPVPATTPTPTADGEAVVPYDQPVIHQTQQVEREIVTEESQGAGEFIPQTAIRTAEQKVQVQIEKDSAAAIQQILTPGGGLRNSTAVQALQQANIETEKYILAARELEGTVLTKQQELAKRTEFQTEKLTDEIMKRLSNNPDYEPGTENYAAARETISDKVRATIERQNRDLF